MHGFHKDHELRPPRQADLFASRVAKMSYSDRIRGNSCASRQKSYSLMNSFQRLAGFF